MQIIEGLTDAEIAEAHRSADVYAEVQEMTAPLNALVGLIHAFEWLDIRRKTDRAVLRKAFFDGQFGDPMQIALGNAAVDTRREEGIRFAALYAEARTLLTEEHFLNWQVAFPGIWSNWESEGLTGGFDAVIGNPPWDRMKLQQVEWFAARRPEIAIAQRASDRQRMIDALGTANDPLAKEFATANERAEAAVRLARSGGDYPLLSGGDINIYSLFVERATTLVKPQGIIGLLTPSGIASDKTSAPFFKAIAVGGRLRVFYDFENKKVFFPDVHASFKFCVFVASRAASSEPAKCAFYLHNVAELNDPERCFPLSAADFARVNPNTGTAPIFRTQHDADLTTAIYGRLPVIADRSSGIEVKVWPVRYATMFHMTNDSHHFRTRQELKDKEGAYPIGENRWGSPSGEWVPLYAGRMIHQFDHRAASVTVNAANIHNAAFSGEVTADQKANPAFLPTPQYWVPAREISFPAGLGWAIAFRDIARATDVRTMISAAVPLVGLGNTAPMILPDDTEEFRENAPLLLGNLGAIVLDYVARQKAQSTHLNWYIVEQLPVVPPAQYGASSFGKKTAGQIVREIVLELTYTAHDMADFARDMGHVDALGNVGPPFVWNEERRLDLRAKLDAVYFHLYGVTDRDDIRYIYSTFPIVEREEVAAFGEYRSRDLCLSWMSALSAGDPDAKIKS